MIGYTEFNQINPFRVLDKIKGWTKLLYFDYHLFYQYKHNTFNQVLVIKYKEYEKVPKVFSSQKAKHIKS